MVDGAITDKPVTDTDKPGTDKMAADAVAGAQQARAQASDHSPRRTEAAEVRAWRFEKVRRWPRRVRTFGLRIFVICLSAVVVFYVLGQVLPLTTTATKGVARSSVPHQM